jgi:hypothetical protein
MTPEPIQHAENVAMTINPWSGPNTTSMAITYDHTKVRIACWEYSANGWDGPHTCLTMPTHAVAWMRPRFELIDGSLLGRPSEPDAGSVDQDAGPGDRAGRHIDGGEGA